MKRIIEQIFRWHPKYSRSQSRLLDQMLPCPLESPLKTRNYVIVEEDEVVKQMFLRLQHEISKLRTQNFHNPTSNIWVESGSLAEKRGYFFMQPWNQEGWLFERAPHGWTIARAEKIVEMKTFLRGSLTWDAVVLFQPESGEGLTRLSSKIFAQELMGFPIYLQQIIEKMQIGQPFISAP